MATTTVLALDQSTSGTKALLFDEAGHVLDREARPHRQHYPQPGWVEHDAEEIFQNTLTVLGQVAERAAAAGHQPVCLSLTNQRETVVIFDRHTGRPLHPALVWLDRRGDVLCAAQHQAGRNGDIHHRTGLRVDGYFSGSKLQWLIQERPELARRLATGDAVIGTIDTYLIHRLTNGAVFATDHTNASRTLLFNLHTLDWDDTLCGYWDVPRRALPEIRPSTAHFGETNLNGAWRQPLRLCGVMGDSQASLFAHRCFTPGTAKVTLGTGSSVLMTTGSDLRLSDKGLVSALAWVHDGTPTYALEGIIIYSGATISWLVDQLRLAPDAADIERLAAEVPDNGGVYFVPAFSGLGLPHWQPHARAAITGLSGHSDRRHIARAALESMAYQLRDALEALQQDAGLPMTELHADGGATRNDMLMQFAADLTGQRLQVPAIADCSPLGAAMAGLLGTGHVTSLEALAQLPREERVYSPRGDVEIIARRWQGWRAAVAQVLAGAPASVG